MNQDVIDYESFVCIVTYGRSGSTLLQKYLNSFEDVLIRGENLNVLYYFCKAISDVEKHPEYTSRRDDISRRQEERVSYAKDVIGSPSDPWFGAEGVLVDRLRSDIHDLFTRNFIRPEEKHRVIGFKEIRWQNDPQYFEEFMRQIEMTFRNVKVLVLKRKWEDLSKSNWWRRVPQEKVRRLIEGADAAFEAYGASNETWHFLNYEDMVADPRALEQVASFIGRPFDAEVASAVLTDRLLHGK